jgi:hypothetical protein
MEVSKTLKGYYYMDLRKRRIDIKTRQEFDYTKEWAVAALPGDRGRSGVLTFIVDQTKTIYVTDKMHSQPQYPHSPGGSGWTRIDTLEDLKKFQETVATRNKQDFFTPVSWTTGRCFRPPVVTRCY